MQSMSVFVWAALAIFVFYTTGKKDRPLAIAMSGFFVFMAVWYGLRSFAGLDMFGGALGIAFRVIVVTYAVAIIAAWLLRYHFKNKK